MNRFSIGLIFFALLGCLSAPLHSQAPQRYTSSEIKAGLEKLQSLKTVLYIAAHPDDENTRLIAYLGNETQAQTGYLSLTRGDGGQNLIGPEMGDLLGMIRTQELLQARGVDGGIQFFTRARDFGYSKTAEETLVIWDKEKILSDIVFVIRQFRPNVIITRFPPDDRAGHGHHQASAMLAEEAFVAAADPNRFKEQLKYTQVWQTKSLYFNTSWWFYGSEANFDPKGLVGIDVGAYNTLLGKSYTEIAAESRSMHKSQGFGSTGTRGESIEYLDYVMGDSLTADYFKPGDGWATVQGGAEVASWLKKANEAYDVSKPEQAVPALAKAYAAMENIDDPRVKLKMNDTKEMIRAAMGLYLEMSASNWSASPGDSVEVTFEAINRSDIPAKMLNLDQFSEVLLSQNILQGNKDINEKFGMKLPNDKDFFQPYWLKQAGTPGVFKVEDQTLIGLAENDPAVVWEIDVEIEGVVIPFEIPLVYKNNDPVKGEQYRPFVVLPPLTINSDQQVMVFVNTKARKLSLKLIAQKDGVSGKIMVQIPDKWKVNKNTFDFALAQSGEEKQLEIEITAPAKDDIAQLQIYAEVGGKKYKLGITTLTYDHIPTQVYFSDATVQLVSVPMTIKPLEVGYIVGAGDEIPENLEHIGIHVKMIDADVSAEELNKLDAVVLGVRAFNTQERLKYAHDRLMAYVEQGGTVIVQFNTSFRLVTDEIAPYPLELSRLRITEEDAKVEILHAEHRLMNVPNKITSADFDGWVQERGLYFPDKWDDQYTAMLRMNDTGEEPLDGALLVAQYGKGYFIYTGLSLFRQLPAGVPGAYRLFVNMLSLSSE